VAAKKVNFGNNKAQKQENLDRWVEERSLESTAKSVKMKRLTLDIPESLHRQIKMTAAAEGVAMADLLRELLQNHFDK